MTEYLHPRDIDEFVDQVQTKYLECRVHGHSRTPSNVNLVDAAEYGILGGRDQFALKTLRCRNRCGVIWTQVINMRTGEVVIDGGPDYSRAPLYLAKGLGRLDRYGRNRLRLEQLARWMEAHA